MSALPLQSRVGTGAVRRRLLADSLLAAAALIALAPQAAAADFTFGFGAGFAPDYDGSEDYEAVPSWLFSADSLYDPATCITLRGPQLRSNFVPHRQLRAGISGLYVPERDEVDDDRVDAMPKSDAALLLGGGLGWDFFPQNDLSLTLAVDLLYDVANNNGGILQPYVSYFNALAGSPLSVGAEVFTTLAQYKLLVGDAADSPVVDDRGSEHQLLAGVTINLHF